MMNNNECLCSTLSHIQNILILFLILSSFHSHEQNGLQTIRRDKLHILITQTVTLITFDHSVRTLQEPFN